ncbi:hypothetical protein ACFLU8_02855 [Chloroflexota bacterium]
MGLFEVMNTLEATTLPPGYSIYSSFFLLMSCFLPPSFLDCFKMSTGVYTIGRDITELFMIAPEVVGVYKCPELKEMSKKAAKDITGKHDVDEDVVSEIIQDYTEIIRDAPERETPYYSD